MSSLFQDRLTALERIQFTKHLSIMLKSGIPLSGAMEVLQRQAAKPALRRMVGMMGTRLANGASLHETLSAFPSTFDALYTNLVRIGEDSGTLEKNLDYLSVFLRKRLEFRKKIIAALTYPGIVLGLAVLVSVLLSIFALPNLIDLFDSLDVALPASTRSLLFIAAIMRDHGFLIVGGTIAAIVALRFVVTIKTIKRYYDALILRIPVFGPFLRNVEMASFSRNLGIMLQSGLPIGTALAVQEAASNNMTFAAYVGHIRSGVEKGQSLATILGQPSLAGFPPLATSMIGVGEATGRLDGTLLYLGEYYDDEVDTTAKNFSSLVDPIVLIGVGAIVAFVALSVISPIYQFTGSIQ